MFNLIGIRYFGEVMRAVVQVLNNSQNHRATTLILVFLRFGIDCGLSVDRWLALGVEPYLRDGYRWYFYS